MASASLTPPKFQDYLFIQGKDGGAEAASQLQQEIKKQLIDLYPEASTSDWHIVVNVVLNLQGLGTKLQACGIIDNPNAFQAFGRAFGLAQPLFNFIDAGSGKERADHKIRETLRLYLPIPQCKHIFFGPCHDNGYLPVLEPYKRDSAISSRLSLVETRPAEPGFRELGFRMISFPRIFRDTDLPSGRRMQSVSSPAHTPTTMPVRTMSTNHHVAAAAPFVPQTLPTPLQASKSTSPAPSSDSATSGTWATVGKGAQGSKNINIAPTKTAPRRFVIVNVDDERLDQPFPRPDPAAEKRFTARLKEHGKCCNDFHLLGRCPANEYCDYQHGERLSPGETLVLKHKARSRTCPQRYNCRNPDCTFGHHCKFGKGCLTDSCWFEDTHYMELVGLSSLWRCSGVKHANRK